MPHNFIDNIDMDECMAILKEMFGRKYKTNAKANKIATHEELDKAVEHYTNYYKKAPTKSIGLIKKLLQEQFLKFLKESQFKKVNKSILSC